MRIDCCVCHEAIVDLNEAEWLTPPLPYVPGTPMGWAHLPDCAERWPECRGVWPTASTDVAMAERRARVITLMTERMPPLPGPIEGQTVAVGCDACGTRMWIDGPPDADVAQLLAMAMADWTRRPNGDDLCPRCS